MAGALDEQGQQHRGAPPGPVVEDCRHPCCYVTGQGCDGQGCHGSCFGLTFLPCFFVAGMPTQANQLNWSGPRWYAKGMHAIKRNDETGLRRIVDGAGWKPDNAKKTQKTNKPEVQVQAQNQSRFGCTCANYGYNHCILCCWPDSSWEYLASMSHLGTLLMDAANASGNATVAAILQGNYAKHLTATGATRYLASPTCDNLGLATPDVLKHIFATASAQVKAEVFAAGSGIRGAIVAAIPANSIQALVPELLAKTRTAAGGARLAFGLPPAFAALAALLSHPDLFQDKITDVDLAKLGKAMYLSFENVLPEHMPSRLAGGREGFAKAAADAHLTAAARK